MSIGGNVDFPVERSSAPASVGERERLLDNPPWGRVFTDHMVTMRYTPENGWHDGRIAQREALAQHPASLSLHYALEIFEGMKVYRQPDGGAALFRPDANARRFRASAERLAMTPLPDELFVESVRALASTERDWIPTAEGASLYLRPFMLGTEVALGTKVSTDYLYCVIASPVTGFFKGGGSAVKIWVSDEYIRAAPGGTGAAKCGGNYASGLAAQAEAVRKGCDQVVFLDAIERRWVEEMGSMNIFFVFDDNSLRTPPLTGTILPGITRDSLITLARGLGLTVREEPYAIDQWQKDAESGRLRESFACGTAAVITPIGEVKGRRHNFVIGNGEAGPLTARLKAALTDIQFGRSEDVYGWRDRLF